MSKEKQAELDVVISDKEKAEAAHKESVVVLEATVAGLIAEIEEKDEQLIAVAKQAVDIEALRTRNNELEATLTASAEEKVQVSVLEEKIASLEVENEGLKEDVTAASGAVDEAASEETAFLKSENERLRNVLEDEKLNSRVSDLVSAELEQLKDEK